MTEFANPVIEVASLSKRYELGEISVTALNEVSLSIARGEFVAIMGASGSGKSTLLNILGCLDRPTSGYYRLGGTDVGALDEPSLAQFGVSEWALFFRVTICFPERPPWKMSNCH